jgi:DNA-binding transcriptional LysR family regulator
MMISVVQAQCVVAVAKFGSFRKAAASLFMAQPAVSANVDKVERTLRMALFERTNAGATLTPNGVTLLPHFEAMLASHESVMVKSAQIKSGEEPVLRIASHRIGQVIILPPALHAMQTTMGPMAIDIVNADELRAAELVKSGQVDLGLGFRVAGAVALEPRLHEVVTLTAPIVMYCRPDHPLAARAEVSVADLGDETIICTRAAERIFQNQLHEGVGRSRVIVDDAQVALQMVTDGVGIAPLVDGLEALVSVPVVAVRLAADLAVSSTVMRRADETLSTAADVLWRLLAASAS